MKPSSTQRVWWSRTFLRRELVDAMIFGSFVWTASGEWLWALVAAWAFGTILSRFADLEDLILERE